MRILAVAVLVAGCSIASAALGWWEGAKMVEEYLLSRDYINAKRIVSFLQSSKPIRSCYKGKAVEPIDVTYSVDSHLNVGAFDFLLQSGALDNGFCVRDDAMRLIELHYEKKI